MSTRVSPLHAEDWRAAKPFWIEAFGADDDESPPGPGRHTWRAQDGDETVALGVEREFETWFGGSRVPTAGIAGITVPAEHRGGGHLRPLFAAMLDAATERGAQISGLYPTSTGIYRSLGYAPVAQLDDVAVPTHLLDVRGDAAPVRRAGHDDLPAVAAAYTAWAREHRGPLTRDGISFPDLAKAFTSETTGVTLAESSPGQVSGYAAWDRGKGYGADAVLTVRELVALDRPSLVGLLRALGSFASVTPVTVVRTSTADEWTGLLRSDESRVQWRGTYMVKVLDVAAFSYLSPAPGLSAELPFRWNDQAFVLTASSGRVEVAPTSSASRTLDDTALVQTLFGVADARTLRRLGHLTDDAADDAAWDALAAGPRSAIANYY
ncbi:enhanced intracellular survival protein Eis [Aeromicrobium sp. Leaf350]|uniref:GNAT family N-acetyltransferase n=1 Tax=Aeromicrobium sp. Leaf350 TaxID=2876565 RepID=UPI001E3E5771|nr:GNAT family N-acetyltransferase [Aeromicrobium sp. Leaf350]